MVPLRARELSWASEMPHTVRKSGHDEPLFAAILDCCRLSSLFPLSIEAQKLLSWRWVRNRKLGTPEKLRQLSREDKIQLDRRPVVQATHQPRCEGQFDKLPVLIKISSTPLLVLDLLPLHHIFRNGETLKRWLSAPSSPTLYVERV